jgi:hypothetical protein
MAKKSEQRTKMEELLAYLEKLALEQHYKKIHYAHFDIGGGKLTLAVANEPSDPICARFGWSLCTPTDQFDRLDGRLRAMRRFVGADTAEFCDSPSDFPLSEIRPHDLCEVVARYFIEETDRQGLLPLWACCDPVLRG